MDRSKQDWTELRRRLDLAGIREGQELGPHFPRHECLVYPLRLELDAPDGSEGPILVVDTDEPDFETKPWSARDGLQAFLALSTADDVFAYAKRFGLLGLCAEHGLLFLHGRIGYRWWSETKCMPGWTWERTGDWLRLGQCLRAILALAVQVREDESASVGNEVRSRIEAGLGWEAGHATKIYDVFGSMGLLRASLDEALAISGVRPTLHAGGEANALSIRIAPVTDPFLSLGGLLARDLVFAVARSNGVAICDGCKQPYLPTDKKGRPRKPRSDRLHFCRRCQERSVPEKLRKRRQRAKAK